VLWTLGSNSGMPPFDVSEHPNARPSPRGAGSMHRSVDLDQRPLAGQE